LPNERRIHFAPFALDLVNECLWRGSLVIKLRPKAFAVLAYLVSRPGQLVTKDNLIAVVWREAFVGDAVLKVAIRQIREALSDDAKSPRFIETSHRRGYRFIGVISALQAIAGGRTDDGATAARPQQPDLPAGIVGRAHALSRMRAWFDSARRGECQVAFVTGEAGIGKTCLVSAFVSSSAASSQASIGHAQCIELYGTSEPYLPIFEAMQRLGAEIGVDKLAST
jgi:DNA-binding winged helix-turn-helix (wHTH) protein